MGSGVRKTWVQILSRPHTSHVSLHKLYHLLGPQFLQQRNEIPFPHQVTAEPGPELIRPRPQGSSPVYECVTEGAGFRLPVSPLGRPTQAEGGLSWERHRWPHRL